jgi:hypothetical protein
MRGRLLQKSDTESPAKAASLLGCRRAIRGALL